MLIFYAVYFCKMLAQHRKNIKTQQLGKGKGKDKHVRRIEIMVSIATLVIVPVELVSILYGLNCAPDVVRLSGVIIGLFGDIVFLLAVVTMKDSWRAGIPVENTLPLVTDGIYRFSRNPAFVGFDLLYIGLMCMYCNVVMVVCTVCAVVALHMQILQEENFLKCTFGEPYLSYQKITSRYLGRKLRL